MPTVSDDFSEFEERATLTQRRQMSSGAAKLNRSRLEPKMADDSDVEEESSKSRLVIWVLVVLIVAVGAYVGYQNFMQNGSEDTDNTDVTVTVTEPEESLESKVIKDGIYADSTAKNIQSKSDFNTEKKSVGKSSDATYSIDNVQVTKYSTFTRFEFTLSQIPDETGEVATTEPFPGISATYDTAAKTITLLFTQIDGNNSDYFEDVALNLNTTTIQNMTHKTDIPNEQETYVVNMKSSLGFAMKAVADTKTLIVDVLDTNKASTPTTAVTETVTTAVTPTPVVTTTTPVISTTPAVTTSSSTSFSTSAQQIVSTLGTNSFKVMDGYKCGDNFSSPTTKTRYNGMFTFEQTFDMDVYPNVDASYNGNTLVVEVDNYAVASAGKRTYDLDTICGPLVNVNTMSVSTASNVKKYEFTVDTANEYRVVFDMEKKVMQIQIKN